MRAYELHDASWTRIVTHRVRRPNVIRAKMRSRRRRDPLIAVDGQLVLLDGNHLRDPRSGSVVSRRELLHRLIEALSCDLVDGVVATADVLEDLTLLNMLERRLAICTVAVNGYEGAPAEMVARDCFDAGRIQSHGRGDEAVPGPIAILHEANVPILADVRLPPDDTRAELETFWTDWIEPMHGVASSMTTNGGVWLTLPAVNGVTDLAGLIGFPILIRDTEVPVSPEAWVNLFDAQLPLTVRGLVLGSSALFPTEGSVAEATAQIAAAVRG